MSRLILLPVAAVQVHEKTLWLQMWGLLYMTVRALLTGQPHNWKYVEVAFFCDHFPYEMPEWQSIVGSLGPDVAYSEILTSLRNAPRTDAQAEALHNRDEVALVHAFRVICETPDFGVVERPKIQLKQFDGSSVSDIPELEPETGSNVLRVIPDSTDVTVLDFPATSAPTKAKAGKKRPVGELPTQKDEHVKRRLNVLDSAKDASWMEAARESLHNSMYADTTWHSHLSEVNLYRNLCDLWLILPFPISVTSVQNFVAAMKHGGYPGSTIKQYVNSVFRQQLLLFMPIPDEIRNFKVMMMRGVMRNAGEAHHMLPLTMEHLRAIRNHVTGAFKSFLFRISVITWFFLLRADESIGRERGRGLCKSSFDFDDARKRVTISLGSTKMNQQASVCRRSHFCVCAHVQHMTSLDHILPICPYCASKQVYELSQNIHDDLPLVPEFTGRKGGMLPQESDLLKFLRDSMIKAGIKVYDEVLGKFLFGTHSLRRGGAQALAVAGYTLEQIKFFGRWLSDAVELYLLQMPMETHGLYLASGMLGVLQLSGEDPLDDGPANVDAVVRTMTPVELVPGTDISILLPDCVQLPPLELSGNDDELKQALKDAQSGWYDVTIEAMLPEYDVSRPALAACQHESLIFHESIQVTFPDDFRDLSARRRDDRCFVVSCSGMPPLYVVCLKVGHVPFRVR